MPATSVLFRDSLMVRWCFSPAIDSEMLCNLDSTLITKETLLSVFILFFTANSWPLAEIPNSQQQLFVLIPHFSPTVKWKQNV